MLEIDLSSSTKSTTLLTSWRLSSLAANRLISCRNGLRKSSPLFPTQISQSLSTMHLLMPPKILMFLSRLSPSKILSAFLCVFPFQIFLTTMRLSLHSICHTVSATKDQARYCTTLRKRAWQASFLLEPCVSLRAMSFISLTLIWTLRV